MTSERYTSATVTSTPYYHLPLPVPVSRMFALPLYLDLVYQCVSLQINLCLYLRYFLSLYQNTPVYYSEFLDGSDSRSLREGGMGPVLHPTNFSSGRRRTTCADLHPGHLHAQYVKHEPHTHTQTLLSKVPWVNRGGSLFHFVLVSSLLLQ